MRLLLAATKDAEWKTAILFGFYAGLRLGDAVGLDWQNVDLKDELLSYRASKTRKQEEVPLHQRVKRHLESLRGERRGKLCPRLAAQNVAGRSGLSRQFLEIVERAGITSASEASATARCRRFSSKTFHSLRHGFISAMANAGIAPELRQKLSGHSSQDVHRQYTHLQLEPLRKAVRSIK